MISMPDDPGKDLYTFGHEGKEHQEIGIPKRHSKHQSQGEVANHCRPLWEKKMRGVLPADDRDMSDPTVKGNEWDTNYARRTHMATRCASVYSRIDIYMVTDDMYLNYK